LLTVMIAPRARDGKSFRTACPRGENARKASKISERRSRTR
jgi:hypothetical protein